MDEATEAYNAQPHKAGHVAPEDVETMKTASLRVYQDNAEKFRHNLAPWPIARTVGDSAGEGCRGGVGGHH